MTTAARIPGPAMDVPHEWSFHNAEQAAEAIWEALRLAKRRAPAMVAQETGLALHELWSALLPTVLITLGVMAASSALGAAVGGALGFFVGGVGAAPGAVLGGQAGFDLAAAALTWMGLAFLLSSIAKGGFKVASLALSAIRRAANAALDDEHRNWEIHAAAEDLARAAALFVLMLLQALVAWLLKRPALASFREARLSAAAAGKVMSSSGEAVASAEAAVAELVAWLIKVPADWVQAN